MMRYGCSKTHIKSEDHFAFAEHVQKAPEIGQVFIDLYFEGYDEESRRYKPNNALAKRYPDRGLPYGPV